MQVSTNTVVADYKLFEAFAKASEKAILDRKFVYLAFDGSVFSLHIEGRTASVCLRVPVESKAPVFSAGLDAERFLASFKKLYEGDITFKIEKSAVKLIKDNIKIKFPMVSQRSYIDIPEGIRITGESKDWLTENLISAMATIEEMAKKAKTDKFLGVLFETNSKSSRITKFSQSALFFASTVPIFQESYRTLIPDVIAIMAKAFPKQIEEFVFSRTKIGVKLEQGVEVYASIPYDTYPIGYINGLGLTDEVCMLPGDAVGYVFKTSQLFNAVDLVATTLGDAESWISLSAIGKSEDKLVWEIGGKTYNKVEVSEKVLSTDGPIVNAFGVNKKRMLRCLASFGEQVYLYDLSNSTLAVTNEQGNRAALLIKALI